MTTRLQPARLRRPAIVVPAVVLTVALVGAQDWRAAALASFDEAWQTIRDAYYDPTFGGLVWADVARELRPRVESADTLDEARAVIREMLGRLRRSHVGLLTSSAADALPGPASVPIEVRIVHGRPVITRVLDPSAEVAGLTPGQIIDAVDGTVVPAVSDAVDPAAARAAALEAWRATERALHGVTGSETVLRVHGPDGGRHDRRVTRIRLPGETVTVGNLPPLRIEFDARDVVTPGGRRAGVVRFNVWMAAVAEPIAAAIDRFRQHDGLVIDLRGNPGGLAAMMTGVAGHVIGEPVVLGTMRTRQTELTFTVNPRLVTPDGRRVEVYRGPLVILVDELTASTSETFAGSLQSLGRARVVGRQTMGQALAALTRRLPIGDVLMYPIGDYTPAGGRSLEEVGVIPDISVSLSVEALAAGRDEVLEAALRWLDAGRANPPRVVRK